MKITEEIFYKKHFSTSIYQLIKKDEQKIINNFIEMLDLQKLIPKTTAKDRDKFNKTFTNIEKEYIRFIVNFFSDLDQNTADLGSGLNKLLKKKDYKSSMFLLRGHIESILYNIYLTFKLFYHIRKNDYSSFIKLILRANYSVNKISFKLKELRQSSAIYKKIIDNDSKGKRIHINDCLNFFRKTNFKKIIIDTKKLYNFKEFGNSNPLNYEDLDEFFIKFDNEFLYYVYDKLCEIIHPTALAIHSKNDKITKIDFVNLLYLSANSNITFINFLCINFKSYIIKEVKKNKTDYINSFRDYLHNK